MKIFRGLKKSVTVVLTLVLLAVFCSSCADGRIEDGAAEATEQPTAEPTREPEDPMRAKVIVIAGQSNAVGATFHSNLIKSLGRDVYKKYRAGFENVKLAFYCEAGGKDGENANSNFDANADGTQMIDDVFDSVTLGQSWNNIYFGPEVGMAEYLSEHYPEETFYIIKVAKGDVSIPSHWQEDGACYQKLREALNVCLTALENEGYHPQIISFCWMQGENDAGTDELTAAYRQNLEDMIERFRRDYAAYAPVRGIPLIDAGISSHWKNYEQINAIKKEFADSSVNNYYFDTMAEGLTYDKEPEDLAHFDSDSVVKLGALFASYVMQAYERE